jgi:hypothetical protein
MQIFKRNSDIAARRAARRTLRRVCPIEVEPLDEASKGQPCVAPDRHRRMRPQPTLATRNDQTIAADELLRRLGFIEGLGRQVQ